ncbi:MAG: MgtC/SapB family protein [Myxococcaceae bacterium]
MDPLTLAARLGLSAVFGALLGIERELRGHAAGFRTHILVALSACLFTLVGATGFGPPGTSGLDTTRIASQVVVGIGFLGAGVIVRQGPSVRGLTTAANLWAAAAVGVAIGVGMYEAGAIAAAIALVVLVVLKPVERWLEKRRGPAPKHADHPGP